MRIIFVNVFFGGTEKLCSPAVLSTRSENAYTGVLFKTVLVRCTRCPWTMYKIFLSLFHTESTMSQHIYFYHTNKITYAGVDFMHTFPKCLDGERDSEKRGQRGELLWKQKGKASECVLV